jgi:hypothetical protein
MPAIAWFQHRSPRFRLTVELGFVVLFIAAQVLTAVAVWLSASSDAHAKAAAHDAARAAASAQRLARCVKQISSIRGNATSLDAVANVIFMRAIDKFEHAAFPPKHLTRAQYRVVSAELTHATDRAVAILDKDQRIRKRNTYARCTP